MGSRPVSRSHSRTKFWRSCGKFFILYRAFNFYFKKKQYLGKWYQITRFPNPFELGNCSTAEYGPVTNGTVAVHNVEIRNGEESSVDGTAELTNPNSTEAKLTVKFFNPGTIKWNLFKDFWKCFFRFRCTVLGTWHWLQKLYAGLGLSSWARIPHS